MMTKVTFVIFLSRLITYCQYSICLKFPVKWTKIFWDTACFFTAGLLAHPPAQVGLMTFFYWWEIDTKIRTYMDKFIDQPAIALWFTGRGSKKVLWAASWNPRVTSLETFPDYVPWNSIFFFFLVILRLYYNLHFNIKSFASLTSSLTFLDEQLVHK